MSKEYYSSTFLTKYADAKIYEFGFNTFKTILDCLFHITYIKSDSLFFQRPMNILVAEQNNDLILGIDFSKAICFGNQIRMYDTASKSESIETVLSNRFQSMAMHAEMFIKFPIDSFKRLNGTTTYIYKKYETVESRHKYFLNSDVLNNNIDFNVCADAILKSFRSSNIIGGEGMWIDPIFKERNLTINPTLCFCILPFNQDRLDIFDKIIKPELSEKFGITATRSGNIFDANLNIMESIWTYINQASFIIADISDKNPNVFYELGICHTIGKKVIILCDEKSYEEDYNNALPFDIYGIYIIRYKNTAIGSKKMLESIDKTVEAIRSGTHYLE